MVYQISDRFLIPFITYKTGRDERQDVLAGFKSERYNAIVTSKVLDEGVDVPDVELGVIISGTGSKREIIQRLGRLLRPKQDDRRARLVELVSSHTHETRTSAKRMSALKEKNKRRRGDDGDASAAATTTATTPPDTRDKTSTETPDRGMIS